MGAPGWDDAPPAPFRVQRERRHVTLVWPYYENPRWLYEQIAALILYPRKLLDNFTLIIADDGSPKAPAENVIRSCFSEKVTPLLSLRLFRIKVDVRWNWLAARNLAMHHAAGWCLLTDIDHVVPQVTLDGLQRAEGLSLSTFYTLRRTDRSEKEIHSHPNSFFCHRGLFWQAGGYDEELSGHYGTDGDWRRRAAATGNVRMLPLYLDRWEKRGDSSTTHYQRKQAVDAGKKAIIRTRGPGWRPRSLSFPWEEIKI